MKTIITLLSGIFCFAVAGAQHRASFGASFVTGMKLAPGKNLNWFSTFDLGLYIRVRPAHDQGLAFSGKVSMAYDPVRYSINSYRGFTIYQHKLAFDGLIHFPTKNEKMNLLGGIGLEYLFEPILGYGIYSDDKSVTNFQMDLDSNMNVINEYRRKIMPSASVGILYLPLRNKRFSACLILKKQLLDLFTDDILIAFYTDRSNYGKVSFNYRPVFLKLGISYDLW